MKYLNKGSKVMQILCLLKHVEEVEDRSSTPVGYNAMYVRDVKDCWNYIVYVMLFLSEMSKT